MQIDNQLKYLYSIQRDEIKTKRHAFFAPVKIVKFVGFTPWIVENLLSK